MQEQTEKQENQQAQQENPENPQENQQENGQTVEEQTTAGGGQPSGVQETFSPAFSLDQLKNYDFLRSNLYIVPERASVLPQDLDGETLLSMDMSIAKDPSVPQILIYHTHGSETFADSTDDIKGTGIIAAGAKLAEYLSSVYGYNVIHCTEIFDNVNGVFDRSKAYDYSRETVQQILTDNPGIQVMIDLHRDGVRDDLHLVTDVNGKPTAQIMFFNGVSRSSAKGDIAYLYNRYRSQNLSFSLQAKLEALGKYPDFTRKNYIDAYQYNLDLLPRAMLIEAGAQTNTVQEELNAMEPLADILEQHIRTHADITAVCGDDSFATENGTYFEKDPDGRIREVLFNMHQPRGYRSLDVFVMSTDLLRSLVDECQARDQYSFRRDVLQAKQDLLHLQSYTFSGFAAQIRSVQEYYDRSMQLLDKEIREDLFTSDRPIRAKGADKASTYIGPDGVCLNSLVAEGCRIEGTVTLDGEDIFSRKMDVNLLRKRVGMVFQKPNPFPMSIYDNVAYGPRTHGIRNRTDLDAIVEKSLRDAAIWDEVKDRLKKSALGLSGGQQQRLCIARALANEPEVLLMDESTSALDPISTSKIEDLAMELKSEYTIVMVTHNMQQAARVSDQTAFFLLGDLVEYGDTEQLFSMPQDKRTEDYITGRFG